ncbi:hypothetical protein PPERSA_02754 [Pseudocohnilembus persalinus]|uniref:Uncharacterized protein n=1 Tax=Pseudocohnilembus persalinus TaxID=266149 RepID=A0A0V0Q8T5_PSEPJ|nr:hypothetical protein PPERSA_02754 [Pseudocohnilembus persalinus]|eukprot:KRW98606.1 hypothetical protein PPERSA_02754 [Pseudocohnilembus persalinus]
MQKESKKYLCPKAKHYNLPYTFFNITKNGENIFQCSICISEQKKLDMNQKLVVQNLIDENLKDFEIPNWPLIGDELLKQQIREKLENFENFEKEEEIYVDKVKSYFLEIRKQINDKLDQYQKDFINNYKLKRHTENDLKDLIQLFDLTEIRKNIKLYLDGKIDVFKIQEINKQKMEKIPNTDQIRNTFENIETTNEVKIKQSLQFKRSLNIRLISLI